MGLTPSRNQSGERDISGGIPRAGDVNLRRASCQAAAVMMHRGARHGFKHGQCKLPVAAGPSERWLPLHDASA